MVNIEPEKEYSVYEGVRGKLLTKKDVALWKQERFYDFIEFCLLFSEGEGEETVLKATKEKVRKFEKKYLPGHYHPFQEFLIRIDRPTKEKDFSPALFYNRFGNMLRLALGYLKENPQFADDKVKVLVEKNPRLNWCLSLVKEEDTRLGKIIVADQRDADGKYVTTVTPDKLMIDSISKVAGLINEISGSISPNEIQRMKTNDKFSAISKLAFVFNLSRNFKPNANIFKQVNIINAPTEDIEKALLESALGNQE